MSKGERPVAKTLYYTFSKTGGLFAHSNATLQENPIGEWKEEEELAPYLARFNFSLESAFKNEGYEPNEYTVYGSQDSDQYVVEWDDYIDFRLILIESWPDLLSFYAFLRLHFDLVPA